MVWTYQQLATAFNAISPVPSSLSSAIPVLNAQTQTASNQDIQSTSAFDILMSSSTGDWAKIVERSRLTLSGASPPSSADEAVIAAIEAVSLLQSPQTLETSNASVLATLQGCLSALETSDDVSTASAASILALTQVTEPTWQPSIEIADLQECQSSGLISSSIPVN